MLCCSQSMFASGEFKQGEGRSAVRCCGLFSCLYAWRGSAGDWPPVAVPCPASRCARLRDLKVCAPALPLCGCGFIRTSPLRRLRRGAPAPPGARLPRRVARRSGLLAAPASRLLRFAPAAVAAPLRGSAPPAFWRAAARGLVFRPLRRAVAAAGKEKAGLAAGFPGKRKIRTPFSCR